MDDVTIRRTGPDGNVAAFDRFVGLFTSKAYSEEAQHIPVLRAKLREVLEAEHAAPGSHDYKELVTAFNSFPKEELFRAPVGELREQLHLILDLKNEAAVRVSAHYDPMRNNVVALVVLPRESFSAEVRKQIQEALAASSAASYLLLPRDGRGLPGADALLLRCRAALGRAVARDGDRSPTARAHVGGSAARGTDRALRRAPRAGAGAAMAAALSARITRPAPRSPRAASDIERIESLLARRPELQRRVGGPGRRRGRQRASELRMFEVGEALLLSDLMPML